VPVCVYPGVVVSLPVAALDNPLDLLFLLVLAFLLFGKDLPEVARNLGKGIRELKESVNFDEVSDVMNSVNEVRSIASPANIARATFPGAAVVQDAVNAARDVANPFGPPVVPAAGEASDTTSAAASSGPAPPVEPRQPAAPAEPTG
jgi:TatA/E family protein of Tat protein translocase